MNWIKKIEKMKRNRSLTIFSKNEKRNYQKKLKDKGKEKKRE